MDSGWIFVKLLAMFNHGSPGKLASMEAAFILVFKSGESTQMVRIHIIRRVHFRPVGSGWINRLGGDQRGV